MDWQSQIALDTGRTFAAEAPVSERLVFLRKTYLLTLTGLVVAGLGGWAGATVLLPLISGLGGMLALFVVLIASLFFAQAVRAKPGLNAFAFYLFTAVAGATLGPILWIATQAAGGQPTLILKALVITGFIITGLSGYVFVTKKDFSFLHGALTIGLFGLIGVGLISLFFGGLGASGSIVFSAAGALLFSGFVLYDTSRIVRTHPVNDSMGAALDLFLDFFLLFQYILILVIQLSGNRD